MVSSYSSAQAGWTHAIPHAASDAANTVRRSTWLMVNSWWLGKDRSATQPRVLSGLGPTALQDGRAGRAGCGLMAAPIHRARLSHEIAVRCESAAAPAGRAGP